MRNKFYTPSANGCGIVGMKISTEYLPTKDMELCCNEHDLCYDTCNNDKELCDLDFRRCLHKICDKMTTFGDIGVKGIMSSVHLMLVSSQLMSLLFQVVNLRPTLSSQRR